METARAHQLLRPDQERADAQALSARDLGAD